MHVRVLLCSMTLCVLALPATASDQDFKLVKANVTFPSRINAYSRDIKVAYNDGDEATWDSVNLCKVSKITLYWRNGAMTKQSWCLPGPDRA